MALFSEYLKITAVISGSAAKTDLYGLIPLLRHLKFTITSTDLDSITFLKIPVLKDRMVHLYSEEILDLK